MLYSALNCRLKSQHLALSEIIKDVDQQKLQFKPEPGKWSIIDNIAHLVTYQPVFVGRARQILEGNSPAFNVYRADDEPDFIDARTRPLTDLLRKMETDRREIIALVTNLPDHQLALTGIHPKFGTLNIPGWTEFFLLHEAHHLFTIFKLARG